VITISSLRKEIRIYRSEVILTAETDEQGYFSCLLPEGRYDIRSSYGIYTSLISVDLYSDSEEIMVCRINFTVWFLTYLIPIPLVILILIVEGKKLRKPMEIRKYKRLLSRLENLYESGLIEYKIYRRLREEYETKLMELGGREIE